MRPNSSLRCTPQRVVGLNISKGLAVDIFSVGEIAQRLSVPLHRVEYQIRTRDIRPQVTAGGRNFYNKATLQRIAGELQKIDEEKAGI